jgi:ribosome-binding factor A
MTARIARRFIIDAYKKQLAKEEKIKNAKKGLLTKIFLANKKKSNALIDILKESNNLNTMNSDAFKSTSTGDQQHMYKSNEEFLKKYYDAPKGGPKHSIAVTRAHHLTNFLTEYILTAFSSGQFTPPDTAKFKAQNPDFQDDYVFEISRIELLADLTALKIFWLNSGHQKLDAFIEEHLESHTKSYIRQTLTNERVMSYVPRVFFVRDETKALMKKLDEHLRDIKIETENAERAAAANETDENVDETAEQSDENSQVAVVDADDSPPVIAKSVKTVDNLYGVDFNRLIEKIKTGSSGGKSDDGCVRWSHKEMVKAEEEEEKQLAVVRTARADEEARTKFERTIRAYEINKRVKYERVSKSAVLKISMLEVEREKINDELERMREEKEEFR